MKKLILFLLLWCHVLFSQEITGTVYDIKTKEPLPGATIYLDGTTIGTTSDFEGYFQLNIQTSENANVIISFIGYETRVLTPQELENDMSIALTESTNQLNEVDLGLDVWSREKKMGIFIREFLGKEHSSTLCKIVNKKDIKLIHNSSLNTLIAFSDKPIIILNKYLGYEISYNLIDFEVEFIYNFQGLLMPSKVFYSGTSYFKELKNKTKGRILENRKQEYQGSLLHFMRSLATNRLTENKFGIYHGQFPTDPYNYFKLTTEDTMVKVDLTAEQIGVLYNKEYQSSIQPETGTASTFHIDKTGNHSPPNSLIFSGFFGRKRMSSMLPLNYNLN